MRNFIALPSALLLAAPLAAQTPELVVQSAHTRAVTAVAASDDGALLASSEYYDGRLKIWDARSGKELRTIRWPMDIADMAFLPGERRLAVVTTGSTVSILDAERGEELRQLHGPALGEMTIMNIGAAIAVGPTGVIASGVPIPESDGFIHVVRLWSPDGRLLRTLRHPHGVESAARMATALAFDAGGLRLAIGFEDGTVAVWRVSEPTLEWRDAPGWAGSSGGVRDIAFAPDGGMVIAAGGNEAVIWSASSGVRAARLDHGELQVRTAMFSEDMTRVFSGGEDSSLRVWDWRAPGPQRQIQLATHGIWRARPAPTAGQVLVAADNFIGIWAPGTERLAARWGIQARLPEVVPLAGGDSLLVASEGDLAVWDTRIGIHGEPLTDLRGAPSHLTAAPNGRLAAVVSSDAGQSYLAVIEPASGTVRWSNPIEGVRVDPAVFSPDGAIVSVLVDRRRVEGFATATGELAHSIRVAQDRSGAAPATQHLPRTVYDIAFAEGPVVISTGTSSGSDPEPYRLDVWIDGPDDPVATAFIREVGPPAVLRASPSGRHIAWSYPEGFHVRVLDMGSQAEPMLLRGNAREFAFSPDGRSLAVGGGDGTLTVWDLGTGERLARHSAAMSIMDRVRFSDDGSLLVTGSRDGSVHLWTDSGLERLGTMFFSGASRLVVTPGGYYSGAPEAMEAVAFRIGARAYPFEQFDLVLNRPDRVLAALGSTDEELMDLYREAYERRLRRSGLAAGPGPDGAVPPEVRILEDDGRLPMTTGDRALRLRVRATDAKHPIERLHAYINDVPVFGSGGIDVRGSGLSVERALDLTLSEGINKIQVSATNDAGMESLRETVQLSYTGPVERHDLHLITIGVSAYRDPEFTLGYAAKDARDVVALFTERRDGYRRVVVDSLIDERATRENILALRERLLETDVDDEVIIFIAGHGLLDNDLEYYFGTHDMDFSDPASRGVSFALIEGLLDGIPARKKLLLMDTCHAGEVDADEVSVPSESIRVRGFDGSRGLDVGPDVQRTTAWLVDELFADIRRRSGTTVIAAAGGAEFAYESGQWSNGVFTFSLLEALGGLAADADSDGTVSVSELKSYVAGRVIELTGGLQRPVFRQQNVTADFRVF